MRGIYENESFSGITGSFGFFLETKLHQDFRFVGSCRPHWHILSFYEERMQRRIQEEVSSWISPRGEVSPAVTASGHAPPSITKLPWYYWGSREGQGNVLVLLENKLCSHCPGESRQARFSANGIIGNPKIRRFLVCLW